MLKVKQARAISELVDHPSGQVVAVFFEFVERRVVLIGLIGI